jgi:uncharacterized protein (DUF849 family)
MTDVRILTCAVTGAGSTRAQNQNLPVTPEEIANACLDAAAEGASAVHVHVRDPATGEPSMAIEHYRDVVNRIRKSGSDIIINLTAGPGSNFEQDPKNPAVPGAGTTLYSAMRRVEHVLELKPEICTLDISSMNFAGTVFINAPWMAREMATLMRDAGVKPEIEIFDTGDIVLAQDLINEGLIAGEPMFQFVLGGKYAAAAKPELLHYMRDAPRNSVWAGFGIGRMAFPMLAAAYLAGGHLRIGMEDTVYLGRGELTPGNGALVKKARRIVNDLGGEIATPAQAREILKLKKR